MSVERLLRPKSIAIVGASSDPTKTAGRPLRYLRRHGFSGAIYPVNPRYEELDGVRCYPDVASLPAPPDAAIVLIGSARAEAEIKALADIGTGAAVVFAGGYAEVSDVGAARQQALRSAAGRMRLLGPNTVGLVNLTDRVTLSASSALEIEGLAAGKIALVSQSGGILGAVLSRAAHRGVAFSRLVATGNEADLEVSDFVEYLVDDDATQVIALYLEGLRNPKRFRAAAEHAARRGKPIVVYKVGRSEAGARSSASHTAALAGEDRLYDALFAQVGAVRVERFSDIIDVAMALTLRQRIRGKRLAVLTTTGGAGALVADACGLYGFDTPAPSPATTQRLSGLLQDEGFVPERNPIDLTLAGLKPEIMEGAISALMDSADFDALISIVGSSALERPDLVAKPLVQALARADKPLLAYVSPSAPEIVRHLNAAGAPAFENPEGCAAAVNALHWIARTPPTARAAEAPRDVPLPAGTLNEAEAKRLFAEFGVPSVREIVARDADEAGRRAVQLGARVVVKVLARDILHKTERGGVRIGVASADVAGVCRDMAARIGAPIDGFLVQEMVEGGIEMILGFVRDPQLGPAILLGGGGVVAEAYGDTAMRLLPIGQHDADAMIDELKSAKLLRGFRGRPVADIAALKDAVLAFARMAAALDARLVEAEINPLFVLPEGRGVLAADGLAILR